MTRRLRQAIHGATQDRIALADAYGRKGPEAEEALADAQSMAALRGKPFGSFSEEERSVAFQVFVFAEQWEQSLADANPPGSIREEALRAAKSYREVRLAVWGKTQLEALMSEGKSVSVQELLSRPVK